ncbi:MAG: DNA replication/repair protein RecF [Myxococcaceae bacterium]|nr:DNA replication/repair protein RecF [Myxococcaceae bacterium]
MKLLSLECVRFRNLARVQLEPSPRATVAVGHNGAGKTNLLEALYYLATLKPLRATKLAELVTHQQESGSVAGRFLLAGAERELKVEISNGTRGAYADGKRTAKFEDYFGGVSVVAFTPDDLVVVKGSPEGRRNFLDRAVFNRYPAYLAESRAYTKALKSRNRLLKEQASVGHLEAWNETLARAGARLYVRRRALMTELGARASSAFGRIGRTEGSASYRYEPSRLEALDFAAATEEQLAGALQTALEQRVHRDLERGFTSAGPHADDLELTLGGESARAFASQGQSRALVLAWKVAEIENLRDASGVLPLLLLDDVSSELDPDRNTFLMTYLHDSGAQTLLTTTDPSLVRRAAGEGTVWLHVEGGTVTKMPPP